MLSVGKQRILPILYTFFTLMWVLFNKASMVVDVSLHTPSVSTTIVSVTAAAGMVVLPHTKVP